VSRTPAQEVVPPDLPGYRFIEHIGAGGNAQVYLYEQDLPLRKVAVKVLNDSALSEAARRRFTAEANVTADLAHRHIVQVFDAKVTADGRPYIVMPYYPKPNLSVRARRSHFSVADVLRIGIQIGSAVETSHRRGVLHHDIKPQNILTDSYGEPALTDFGIATTKGGDGPEGLSVPWSPPEILFGTAPGDQRADVYSLGATLWHLLVGRSPFEQPGGDNGTFALTGRIKSDPPPRTQRADVPDSLERLLRQAIAKDPAARPQSAMELIRGLQSVEQELRLPLTQPILPADEVQADSRGGDTIARPLPGPNHTSAPRAAAARPARAPAGYTDPRPPGSLAQGGQGPGGRAPADHAQPGQHPPGQLIGPLWGAGTDGRAPGGAAAWSGGAHEGTVARGTRPAAADEDETRRRGPMRVDPNGPAGPPDGDPTRQRGPVRLDPWGPPAPARPREFPPGAREGTTMARSPVVHPGPEHGATGTERARPSARTLALIGGVLVAAAVAVGYFTLSGSSGQQAQNPAGAGQPSALDGGGSAIGPGGGTTPGAPDVKAQPAGGTQVRFSWTYDNPAAGDTFRWQRVSGTAGTPGGTTAKPQVLVAVPKGRSVCVMVEVRRADGQLSAQSHPACWSS
jgi:serine/threonine protein kinase